MPNISELPDEKKRKIDRLFLEAKKMEKQQIIKAYLNVRSENECRWIEDDLGKEYAEQYFNETYKK